MQKIQLKINKIIFHLHDSRRSFFHNIKTILTTLKCYKKMAFLLIQSKANDAEIIFYVFSYKLDSTV